MRPTEKVKENQQQNKCNSIVFKNFISDKQFKKLQNQKKTELHKPSKFKRIFITKFEQIFCYLLVESENTSSGILITEVKLSEPRTAHWVRLLLGEVVDPFTYKRTYASLCYLFNALHTSCLSPLCAVAKRAPPPKPNPAQRKATGRKRREQNQGRSPGISHRSSGISPARFAMIVCELIWAHSMPKVEHDNFFHTSQVPGS